jgi:hypothetical protein
MPGLKESRTHAGALYNTDILRYYIDKDTMIRYIRLESPTYKENKATIKSSGSRVIRLRQYMMQQMSRLENLRFDKEIDLCCCAYPA